MKTSRFGYMRLTRLRDYQMYSVTKRIEFCYGHRLLDYDGVCKHPHGHNAIAEIEVRTPHSTSATWCATSATSSES